MRNLLQVVPLAVLALVASMGSAVMAADCPIQIRLWAGGGDAWFDPGESVRIPADEPRPRLGVYVKTGRNPVVAATEWGYPRDFGFSSARPAQVAEHLRLVQQNPQDIEAGRLRFTLVAPGETFLGYRIVGVAVPGELEQIPEACRSGEVRIEIGPAEEPAAEMPAKAVATGLCEDAVRVKLTSLSGAVLELTDSAAQVVEKTKFRVTVKGELVTSGVRRPVTYVCLVDPESGEVSQLDFQAP